MKTNSISHDLPILVSIMCESTNKKIPTNYTRRCFLRWSAYQRFHNVGLQAYTSFMRIFLGSRLLADPSGLLIDTVGTFINQVVTIFYFSLIFDNFCRPFLAFLTVSCIYWTIYETFVTIFLTYFNHFDFSWSNLNHFLRISKPFLQFLKQFLSSFYHFWPDNLPSFDPFTVHIAYECTLIVSQKQADHHRAHIIKMRRTKREKWTFFSFEH